MAVNRKLTLTFVSLAAFGCLLCIEGYESGAPTEVCDTMLPNHGAPAQTKESPYMLTPNRKTVKPSESITLTLASKDFSKFKGFMIQARNSNGHPIGSFASLPASKNNTEFKGKWKLITCPDGPENNTATHVNPVEKSRVVLTWTAPKDLSTSFKFRYTVAKNGGEYWVGKESETITLNTATTKKN